MTEQNKLQPVELKDQLADLTETMQREDIKLSPEMQKYFDETLGGLTDKMAKGEMPTRKELDEFIRIIKEYIEKERLIKKLNVRFKGNKYLHEDVEWEKVEESLRENLEAFRSINEMEKAGHEPDVYNADEKGFDIGTCSKEAPESGRNCVYDREAAEGLRKEIPGVKFNGSAEEMANEMGIVLMPPEHYENILQKKGEFDIKSWSWLRTFPDIRKSGGVLYGKRAVGIHVNQSRAYTHDVNIGWRGSLRIKWKKP